MLDVITISVVLSVLALVVRADAAVGAGIVAAALAVWCALCKVIQLVPLVALLVAVGSDVVAFSTILTNDAMVCIMSGVCSADRAVICRSVGLGTLWSGIVGLVDGLAIAVVFSWPAVHGVETVVVTLGENWSTFVMV